MRGTKAKMLRRLAELKTVGRPERGLVEAAGKTSRRSRRMIPAHLRHGPDTTRGVYQLLKAAYKRTHGQ